MVAVAFVCILVGFALVVRRRAVPGASSAARMIRIAPGWLQRPHDDDTTPSRSARRAEWLIGLALLAIGVAILWNVPG